MIDIVERLEPAIARIGRAAGEADGLLVYEAMHEIMRLREALRYMVENPEDLESFHRIASVALEGK